MADVSPPTFTIDVLPDDVRRRARVDPNGEVAWRVEDVRDALDAIADAGFVILGLDTRFYDDEGGITEVPFADLSGESMTADVACAEALRALSGYDGDAGDWVLVTVT